MNPDTINNQTEILLLNGHNHIISGSAETFTHKLEI